MVSVVFNLEQTLNSNNMMIRFFALTVLLTGLSSCYYDDPAPYIIFKDTYAQPIYSDTVSVDLNSSHELLVEAGSDNNSVQYLTQKNEEPIVDISRSELVRRSSSGWNGHHSYENVIIDSSFPDSVYTSGDVLRITVRFNSNGWYGKSLFYLVN